MSFGAWSSGYLAMPLFLLAASVANGLFLARATKRLLRAPRSSLSRALMGQAVAELVWVLPCFVQCMIVFAKGSDGGWYQGYEADRTGCNVMGFYSVYSLVAGMGTTVIMALLSALSVCKKPQPSPARTTAAVAGVFGLALVYAVLPLLGAGKYKYISPICYYDWYEPLHSVLVLVWSLPALCAGSALLGVGAWKRPILSLHLLAFLGGWILWLPASIIGLSKSTMPEHMMIVGGVLGHGQALVNPILYGLVWDSTFPEDPKAEDPDRVEKVVTP
eukprot:CAMPEP_0204610850 /NCGR_PEP_ID=MMETSP0661-20131031/61719_1 /ASSEMBLY_ACC=CAM_ASM_000606 /TAXON_ID=109239 /ORGANISM="Alexandrium margalefi, Strain AMGDE01CS-322" /LENGTH=274 /DNA_ID=CAMNT_0051622677 /DNA_START=3 /DNA_END=827 /DNA_ORIENTATION=-